MTRSLPRRDVLKAGATGLLAPSLLPGLSTGSSTGAGLPYALGRGVSGYDLPDGVGQLVLIQLSGGNDGLSTVVPHGDDELYRQRTTTIAPRKALLPVDDYRALHPALGAFRSELDAGRLAIIEGCGYPDPVRSHFRSMEIWHTGDPRGRASGDGWVGKLAAQAWRERPQPDAVVHFGGRAPYSVFSSTHPAVAVESPTAYRWFGDQDVYAMGGSAICEHDASMEGTSGVLAEGAQHVGRDRALRLLRKTLDDAAVSSARVRGAAVSYRTDVKYPNSQLGASLRDVAALVNGGVPTRVFSVLTGGFDTHTNQLPSHSRLMGTLNGALNAFLTDLRRTEDGKNTVVVVFSEFGRRVAENGAKGHDHGKAGPVFVFGSKVKGGLYGEHPSMMELDDGDVAFTTDFRSVYATVIERMFQVDPKAVLGRDYARLGFV